MTMVLSPSSPTALRASPCPRFSDSAARRNLPAPARLRSPQSVRCTAAATCSSPEHTRSPPSVFANSLYAVLGIRMSAGNDEIKAAYRRLARVCHPDAAIAGERDGSRGSAAGSEEFIRIHAAYATLSDPVKRAEYDRKFFRQWTRPMGSFNGLSDPATSSFCKYPRRNWETDQCW